MESSDNLQVKNLFLYLYVRLWPHISKTIYLLYIPDADKRLTVLKNPKNIPGSEEPGDGTGYPLYP
jgi:hypothetical protein